MSWDCSELTRPEDSYVYARNLPRSLALGCAARICLRFVRWRTDRTRPDELPL